MTNAETVKHVYRSLMQGDVPSILATFDPNIEFRLAEGHPYEPDGKPWVGIEAVTTNFFTRAGRDWEAWSLTCDDVIDLGDAVVVEARYHGVYKPNRAPLSAQVCHVWRFRDGRITSFHQYVDTAHLQRVMGGAER